MYVNVCEVQTHAVPYPVPALLYYQPAAQALLQQKMSLITMRAGPGDFAAQIRAASWGIFSCQSSHPHNRMLAPRQGFLVFFLFLVFIS